MANGGKLAEARLARHAAMRMLDDQKSSQILETLAKETDRLVWFLRDGECLDHLCARHARKHRLKLARSLMLNDREICLGKKNGPNQPRTLLLFFLSDVLFI